MTVAYPLQWPAGWPRTASGHRKHGQFSVADRKAHYVGRKPVNIETAISRVRDELERFGLRDRGDMIVSTNLQVNLSGLPRGNQGEPTDPGVAVYWQTPKSRMRVIAVDAYFRVADNIAAIAATLEAMRAIERHGGAQVLERAFTGFAALPASGPSWWEVLGVSPAATEADIQAAYRAKAAKAHPDRGGSHAAMAELNNARDEALKAARGRA